MLELWTLISVYIFLFTWCVVKFTLKRAACRSCKTNVAPTTATDCVDPSNTSYRWTMVELKFGCLTCTCCTCGCSADINVRSPNWKRITWTKHYLQTITLYWRKYTDRVNMLLVHYKTEHAMTRYYKTLTNVSLTQRKSFHALPVFYCFHIYVIYHLVAYHLRPLFLPPQTVLFTAFNSK